MSAGAGARGRRWAARILLLAGSLAAVGVVFEVGLRVAGYEAIYEIYSKPSLLWQKDPELGWHHRRSSEATYVGPRPWPVEFETPIRINSLGLRGAELEALPPGGRRILFLGDSVVAGFEVRDEETFVALSGRRLERELGVPVQTLNGGVRGYGTDQSLLYFRTRGRSLRPDLVVFIHSPNDPRNNMTLHRQRRPFGKPAFSLRPSQATRDLVLVGSPVPDYPLCTQVGLDDAFRVAREDGPLTRALCALETQLADHSALFTFVTYRVRQLPSLLHWMRSLGVQEQQQRDAPGEQAGQARAAWPRALAALGPRTAHAQTPSREPEPRYRLTSRLLVELTREVRAAGALMLMVIDVGEIEHLDVKAIAAAGAEVRLFALSSKRMSAAPIRFENDNHFNRLGHELTADFLTPLLAEMLGAGERG